MRPDYEFKRIDINEAVMRDACTDLDDRVGVSGEELEDAIDFITGKYALGDDELDELRDYAKHAFA